VSPWSGTTEGNPCLVQVVREGKKSLTVLGKSRNFQGEGGVKEEKEHNGRGKKKKLHWSSLVKKTTGSQC